MVWRVLAVLCILYLEENILLSFVNLYFLRCHNNECRYSDRNQFD